MHKGPAVGGWRGHNTTVCLAIRQGDGSIDRSGCYYLHVLPVVAVPRQGLPCLQGDHLWWFVCVWTRG